RALYEVVTSLDVWRYYHDRIWLSYDSVSLLRDPLTDYPGATTKLRMLYVMAASYLVCDNCASVSRPRGPQKYAALPLAVSEWPSDEGRASLAKGGRQSMIRLCLVCRRKRFDIYPESIPSEVQGSYISKQKVKAKYFLGPKTIKSIKDRSWWPEPPNWDRLQGEWSVYPAAKYGSWYSEREALEKARFFYGGDVGILVYKENPQHLTTKSREKMDAYIKLAS
ncbi:hypothetical protein BGX23_003716, partial [Mortierella sp. AD031]